MTLSPIRDNEILHKINKPDINGWEELYDAYAPVMLGSICLLTNDRQLAEQILIDIFINLKIDHSLKPGVQKLSIYLFTYAFNFTAHYLKKQGIQPELKNSSGPSALLRMLCRNNNVLQPFETNSFNITQILNKTSICLVPVFCI